MKTFTTSQSIIISFFLAAHCLAAPTNSTRRLHARELPGEQGMGNSPADRHERAHNTPSAVIAQLFQWNWDSVAKECKWLGEHGYRYVQGKILARSLD